jgi:DNA invertase Pin-like site-specific DNA recombinase
MTNKQAKRPRAVIYTRFSPRRNADDSESIETQLDLCRAYCRRNGLIAGPTFEDRAMSGSEEDRPGLWAAVNALKRGDVLLAYKHDRLARDVYLAELIQREADKRGATIVAVEGGANGASPEQRMIRQVLQAFAEYERKVIAARTRAAMLRHQASGRRMSAQPPYGWKVDPEDDSRLAKDQDEQAVIRRIVKLHAEGFGLREIARELDDEGIPARAGTWYHATIRTILDRSQAA